MVIQGGLKMKKIILTALTLILVFSLAAGCGNKTAPQEASPVDIIIDNDAEDIDDFDFDFDAVFEWPTAFLPIGFPEYPNGIVDYVDGQMGDTGIFITVSETDKATFEAYLKTLEKAGWTIDDLLTDPDDIGISMVKESYWLSIGFEAPDAVFLMVSDWGFFIGNYEWPTDLPYTLPVYPDGELTYLTLDDDYKLSMTIDNTTIDTFKKYVEMVVKAGWEITDTFGEEGDVIELGHFIDYKEDGWWGSVAYADTIADIYVSPPFE
jgi:predicted small lipoprotein YifL